MTVIMIFYVQTPFIIIISVSVHPGLLSNIVISYIQYDSNIIITNVQLVTFNNGVWIVLG